LEAKRRLLHVGPRSQSQGDTVGCAHDDDAMKRALEAIDDACRVVSDRQLDSLNPPPKKGARHDVAAAVEGRGGV